jgi:tRNA G37 N-methylase TrmD
VLLSGNPKLIRDWQEEQALQRTKERRPELLESINNQFKKGLPK